MKAKSLLRQISEEWFEVRSSRTNLKRKYRVVLTWLTVLTMVQILPLDALSAQSSPAEKTAIEIANALTNDDREKLIASAPEMLTKELVDALAKQAQSFVDKGKLNELGPFAQFARNKARQIKYSEGIFRTQRYICIPLFLQDHLSQATECFEQNLEFAQTLNQPSILARALLDITAPLKNQGKYDLALEYERRVLKIVEQLNDARTTVVALNSLASSYSVRGDWNYSIEYTERALQISRTSQTRDQRAEVTSLLNLGLDNLRLGNYDQAMRHIFSGLKLAEELKHTMLINRSLLIVANAYLQINQPELGIPFAERTLALATQINFPEHISLSLETLALLKIKLGQFDGVEDLLQRKLQIDKAGQKIPAISHALDDLANFYMATHNYARAREFSKQKLALDQSHGNKHEENVAILNIGRSYLAEGKFDLALQQAEEAMKSDVLPTQKYLTFSLAGEACIGLKRHSQAVEYFTQSQNISEQVFKQLFGDENSQQNSFEQWLRPYHALLSLFLDENNTQLAFEQGQMSKARILTNVLNHGRTNVKKYMTATEQERERDLLSQLTLLNNLRSRNSANREIEEAKKLDAQWEKASQKYDSFLDSLYAAHPEVKTNRGVLQPLTLNEAGSLLPNDQSAFLNFITTRDETVLFVITKEQGQPKLAVYRIAIKLSDLTAQITRFREALASRNLAIQKPARDLFELLLKPAEQQLRGKTSLTILPDGPLWECPFQALQLKPNTYLIEAFDIAYAPSLPALQAMLKRQSRKPPAGKKEILALGNPALGQTQIPKSRVLLSGESLAQLPETERLVKGLEQIYTSSNSKILIGAQATEKAFKELAGQYHILQLATHGIFNDLNPMYSSLVMAAPQNNEADDGLLEAHELMNLDLNADLAILSACETGRGKASSGEGVIGLSWALQVAGCPTSVVSQWKVESTSTTELMLEFHRQLAHVTKDAPGRYSKALQQAMIKLLLTDKFRHPAYWAGFQLIGVR